MPTPTFSDVFGPLSDGACGHCRSVLGPGAYLADLLQWLAERDTQEATPRTWRDVLLGVHTVGEGFGSGGRRPDIGAIDLSCENAERTLPYIDLVLEALESAVVNSGEVAVDAAHDSVVEPAAMLATPQYVSAEAYGSSHLLTDTTCLDLPFHQPLQEARAFLLQLGVPRAELLNCFAPLEPDSYPSAQEVELCLESMGSWFSSRDAIAAVSTTVSEEKAFWPLDTSLSDAAWLTSVGAVGTLRRAAQLTWPEIQDLVHARYVNPRDESSGDPRIQVQISGDVSDIANYALKLQATSTDLEADDVSRIRQFLRLQRATGWSALVLDRVLTSTGSTEIAVANQDTWVTEIGNVALLSALATLTPTEAASWRATTLDTWEDRTTRDAPTPSHYSATFLSPSVLSANDTRLASWLLVDGQLAGASSDTLADHLDLLAGALGLTNGELTDLLAGLAGDAVEPLTEDSALNLAHVTTLYRWASIGRACALPPADALWLSRKSTLDPYAGDADHGRRLVLLARRLREGGWSVDEVRYVVSGEASERAAPTEGYVQSALGRIRDRLRAIYSALDGGATETAIRDELGRIVAQEFGFDRASLESLRGLSGWGSGDPMSSASGCTFTLAADTSARLAAALAAVVPEGTRGLADLGSGAVLIQITSDVTATISPDHVVTVPQGATWTGTDPDAGTLSTTCAFTVEAGTVLSLPTGTAYTVVDTGVPGSFVASQDIELTEVVRVAGATASWTAELDLPDDWGRDLLRFFLRKEFRDGGEAEDALNPWGDLSAITFPDDFALAALLAKVALVLGRLSLMERERRWWFQPEAVVSGWDATAFSDVLAVTTLRAGASADAHAFDSLVALITLFGLRRGLPGTVPDFVDVLAAAERDGEEEAGASNVAEAIASRTGWVEEDLSTLGAALRSDGDTLTSATGLEGLLARAAIVRRVGASAASVLGWAAAADALTADVSGGVVFASRSRAGSEAAWATVARPVRDELRKAQRDALVAALLARSGRADGDDAIEDAEGLYQHHLIDVSMNPEMLTSRIVQAACTVQLFVHRIALGLERDPTPGVDAPLAEFNADDRREWEWMRTYRVWEAARKVFLFPENWIEPELRDDTTPFFRELQQELVQGDLTPERVEDAALEYLDRLTEVARLDVLAHVNQVETITRADGDHEQAIDRLHVFARTRGTPPAYMYTRRDESGIWRGWEKVECGVAGEHLVPLIHNRRLILCWLLFDPVSNGSTTDPEQLYAVRVSWSEYRDGHWRAPQTQVAYSGTDQLVVSDSSRTRAYVADASGVPVLAVTEFDTSGGEVTYVVPLVLTGVLDAGSTHARDPKAGGSTVPGTYFEEAFYFPVLEFAFAQYGPPGYDFVPALYVAEAPDWPVRCVFGTASYQFLSDRPFFVSVGTRTWAVTPNISDPVVYDLSESDGAREDTSATAQPELEEFGAALRLLGGGPSLEAEIKAELEAAALAASISSFTFPEAAPPTYAFSAFYHPHVEAFAQAVRRDGIFALLDPDPAGAESSLVRQALVTASTEFDFETMLAPLDAVSSYPAQETITFTWTDPYAVYNWELFFHLPYHVGNELFRAGRHEEALRWFHCIFDPRSASSWWKVAALDVDPGTPISDWFAFIGTSESPTRNAFDACVAAWQDDPFNPHLIARLRPGVYSKAVVMRYVDNLLAWGDQLFTQDTIEANNEATQLYVLAKQLLGDRPELLEPTAKPEAKSYGDLLDDGTFDSFGAVVLENYALSDTWAEASGPASEVTLLGSVSDIAYFCIPFNAQLLSYWDTVEDRLFKLRNGMNIAGVVRSLPLFQPPIDPALLVRAAAAGIDIRTAVDDLGGSLPTYRFSVLSARAQALAGSARSLLGLLLSALEKHDAEALAVLRAEQESALARLTIETRERQLADARAAREALNLTAASVQARKAYYDGLLEKGWSDKEEHARDKTMSAIQYALFADAEYRSAGELGKIPDFSIGYPGSFSISFGGSYFARMMTPSADAHARTEGQTRAAASWQLTVAQFQRRKQEWTFQSEQAQAELQQLGAQIAGADIRIEVAERELANQRQQAIYTLETLEWMRSKWTDAQLYGWMSGQLSTLCFQSFQLALQVAKKAERAYQHETGRTDAFIGSVYWDSLRKGVLAGERLLADLERMDAAYLDADAREHELVKPVSLARLDPLALARLRAEGECYFAIAEEAFDLDHPGHYFRRIQSVALTIAAVSGQQAVVNAQLTLHGGVIRRDTTAAAAESDGFSDYPSIVTSVAVQDAGLFQADLRDPRYLPFERRGAISRWHLRLTAQVLRQLDWGTISDVVLHLRYTARDGGTVFAAQREAALASLSALVIGHNDTTFLGTDLDPDGTGPQGGATFLFSAKRDDADSLYEAQQDETATSLSLDVGDDMLGSLSERTVVAVLAVPIASDDATSTPVPGDFTLGNWTVSTIQVGRASAAWFRPPSSSPSPTTTPDNTYTVDIGVPVSNLDDLLLILVVN